MPTLKGIQCSIELKGSSLCLKEYDTFWVEDAVECYVAIPNTPTDFIVHLTCSEYIAPVISAFVYIDGVFQCNRYRRGLLPRDKDGSLEKSKVDLRFEQKEELLQGGRMLAHPWRFERLNIVTAAAIKGLRLPDPDIIQNVGTIDIVILRGQDNPEYPHFNPYDVPRLPKSPLQPRRRNNTARETGALSGLFDGPSDDPLSYHPIWQVDGRGEGSARRYNTHHRHGPLPRTNRQDEPLHDGWYNRDRYSHIDEMDAEEWETDDYFVEAPSPPRSRRYRYRPDGHEHKRHFYGTSPRHIHREHPHRQSFRRAHDNEEDDRRQYEAFRAGLRVGREGAQVEQYTDSPPRRHRQEERHTSQAQPSDSRSRNSRGHTVVVHQFPSSNARNVSIDATDGPETLPQISRSRPNKSSLRDRNVSGSTENTENVIQNVEPLVRKIVKDIVNDIFEHLPSEKPSSKQGGKPNFHYYNHKLEDDDINGEPMDDKSMPGAYPPSTPRVCIRYQSGTRDALPAFSTSRKATNENESQVQPNVNCGRSEYRTASQSINQGSTHHQLTPAKPLTVIQYLANRSNDLGARSNFSFKPSRRTSPSAPCRRRSASRSRPTRRSSHSGDGKRRSSGRAKGTSQDNKNDWGQPAEDNRHESPPNDGASKENESKLQIAGAKTADVGHQSNNNWNADNEKNNWDNSKYQGNSDWDKSTDTQNDGWNNQEHNRDQSNSWDKTNDQQHGDDNWNQSNNNNWSAPAQQQKENNDPPPQSTLIADPPPPPPPEVKDPKLQQNSKTARSLSISQPRSYWYTRAGGDAYTPPACQNEHHNQPSNAARKRHMSAADAEIVPIHPEQPLYTIPEAAAKARHVEHQVRGGKGIEKEHKMGRPLYWDTLDKPYAVIRFKYRSKKCLEEILQYKITETEEEFRERLGTLTKEELIEECIMRKKHDCDSDVEKDEKAKPTVQQPELQVPWP